MRVTEETIGGLFNECRLTPEEFGLKMVEVRHYGACHPSDTAPCRHGEETDTLLASRYYAGDEQELSVPCCERTCPNAWDAGGITEGIGGEYADGGTFSYLGDDETLARRIYLRAHELVADND